MQNCNLLNCVDFTLRMESSGRPEQVHISDQTCSFLGDRYNLEEGEEVDGEYTKLVLTNCARFRFCTLL